MTFSMKELARDIITAQNKVVNIMDAPTKRTESEDDLSEVILNMDAEILEEDVMLSWGKVRTTHWLMVISEIRAGLVDENYNPWPALRKIIRHYISLKGKK